MTASLQRRVCKPSVPLETNEVISEKGPPYDMCQAVGVGHVGTDRDSFVSSEVSGFVAGSGVNLHNSHFGTLAREKDRGGAADFRYRRR